VGDPVDTLTGAVLDGKLEFRLTGPLELWWWRHYDSAQSRRQYALGWGHTHDFERRLHFDVDGIRYEGPLGRTVGFAPLSGDGAEDVNQGYRIRRLAASQYELFHHGEAGMEFRFQSLEQPARLTRLFRGRHAILFEYDRGQLKRVIDSVGRAVKVFHNNAGRLMRLELERGPGKPNTLILAYAYDERGNIVSATHATGHGYRFEYDAANRMVRRTGRKGFSFTFAYDESGRCVKATGDERLYEVSLEYTIPGRVTKVTRADGGTWTYFFDDGGALARVQDPLGGVEEFVRDTAGRLTAKVDSAGNATGITYDACGAPIAETNSFGRVVLSPGDPESKRPQPEPSATNPCEFEYGRSVNVEAIVLPARDDLRPLALGADRERLVTMRRHDRQASHGESPFRVRPLGVNWWPSPDRGRVFNEFGKLVSQQDEMGRSRSWRYDAAGNVEHYTDFDGSVWRYDSGRWHFRKAVTDPLGASVEFGYTPEGEVAWCTDPGQTRSEYVYDPKNVLVEVRRHGRVRDRYVRDAAGGLLAKYAGDGRELLRINLGAGNLPVERVLASGDIHRFAYDEAGRHLHAATEKDIVARAYDTLGRCRLDTRNGRGVEHRFGRWSSPAESVLFERFVIRYRRDASGRIRITDPGGRQHELRTTAHGLVERRMSNGSVETAQYDAEGRCLFKSLQSASGMRWDRRYHWSGEGELRAVEDSQTGATRHEYDAAHRLRKRVLPDGTVEEYLMDRAGNLLGQPGLVNVSMDEGNQLASIDGRSVAYDDRDHLSMRQSQSGPSRYLYDSCDQLVAVETPQGAWAAEYDALGRRSRKRWKGETTEYYWSGEQLAAEVAASGRVRLYLYADNVALMPLMALEYESSEAEPQSCTRYFIFGDQIAAPSRIEDEKGAEVWSADIRPFGGADVAAGARLEFNLRLPGHYCDPELGLHYNRFRYYDPGLGRYLQSDPWGISGGINLYAYRANPLLQVDVRGLGEENDPNCPRQKPDEEGSRPPGPTPQELDGLYGPATKPWMTRPGEGQYPPDAQVVVPGQPVHLQPGTKYVYIIDQNGNMHLAPENGALGRPTKHTDLSQGGPARVSGELNPHPQDPNLWVMNDDSGRYSWRPESGQFVPTRTADQQRNANANLHQGDLGGKSVVSEPELYGDQFENLGTGRNR
jgi:RHS repeat-associated protein